MSQLANVEEKDVLKVLTGKLTKLFPAKHWEGQYGPYSIQNGELELEDQTIKITFMKNEQPESAKGKTITLRSMRGKHGLTGVTYDVESYKNKEGKQVSHPVIKVTAAAKVSFDGETEEEPPVRQSAPVKRVIESDNGLSSIEEIVNFHVSIDRGVRSAYGKKYNEDTIRAYVSSVFIEANRRGITRLLKEDASKPEDQPVEEGPNPEDWASAIVPSGSNKGKKLIELGKPALTKLYQHFLDKGFNTPFAKCVEAAGDALKLDAWDVEGTEEAESDDIPY